MSTVVLSVQILSLALPVYEFQQSLRNVSVWEEMLLGLKYPVESWAFWKTMAVPTRGNGGISRGL